MVSQRIAIGHSRGRKVYLDPKRRSYHLHVIGGSGQGKSKFLEHMIREDILAGHGVCLLDPHGALYNDIVEWCAEKRIDRFRRIHLLDPTSPGFRFSFDPLSRRKDEKPTDRVRNFVEALAQVWGGEDSHATPMIRTTLKAVLTMLIENNLTLAEAFSLTNAVDSGGQREFLMDKLTSPIVRQLWDGYVQAAQKSQADFQFEFGGIRRRLSDILDDEEIRQIFGNPDHAIDFRKCMDEGDVVLVNLSVEGLGEDRARALGAMLVREMFYTAKGRDIDYAENHPFYLYIDECADYLTNDISSLLAQTRKYGLHAILAHQWLEQVRDKSPTIFGAIMAIQNKVVFGGLQDEDAVIMADELFRTEYDIEMPVEATIKPGVVGYHVGWFENWSESTTEGDVESDGEFDSAGTSSGTGQLFDQDGYPVGGTSSDGASQATGANQGRSQISMQSDSSGASQGLIPEMKDMPSGVHSLENVKHLAVKRLRSIPERNAVVKGPGAPSFDIASFTIRDPFVDDEMTLRFKHRVMLESPYVVPAIEAEQTLNLRELELKKNIDFWHAGPIVNDTRSAKEQDDDFYVLIVWYN